MGAVQNAFDLAFRDYVLNGVPGSGANEPIKAEIRAIGAVIEQFIGTVGVSDSIYETVADGIAATTDGELFLVVSPDPEVAFADLYKNVAGVGVYQDQSIPSTASIIAEIEARIPDVSQFLSGYLTIGSDYILVLKTPSGRIIPIMDKDGKLVSANGDGTFERVIDGGSVAHSPGVVDGESIRYFFKSKDGNVIYGFGALGGVFTLVGNTLERANARFFAAKPNQTRFAGQPWTDGATQLLAKPADGRTAWIFAGMGQSNYDGENQDLSDPFLSATPVYPNNALMLQGGPRMFSATGAPVLVPLVENITNQGGGADRQQETPTSGWVNHFVRDYFAAWGEYPTVVGMSVAIGGRSVVGNKLGTIAFQRLQTGIALAVEALRARGFTDIRTVIGWVGGESDTSLAGMNAEAFRDMMVQLRRQASDVIRRITGEITDPPFIMIQPSFVMPGGKPWDQPVRQAMVDLTGTDGFVNAGPAYQFNMTASANPADYHIHRNNPGKYSTGIQLARATMATVLGVAWKDMVPVRSYWAATPGGPVDIFGTRLTIEMNGMGSALVLDISEVRVKLAGLLNYGFIFDDGSGASPSITGVSVDGMKVHIDFSFKPSGADCKLIYAGARNADQYDADGPVYGARGCLRDNAAYTALSGGASHFNWALGFVLRLPRP